eukprot:441324-Pyramimonas_sp.AAC.1
MLTCIVLSSRSWGARSMPTMKYRGRGRFVEVASQCRRSRARPGTTCNISSSNRTATTTSTITATGNTRRKEGRQEGRKKLA